eukprot:3758004-Amphidinium_carterae.1
MVRGFASIDPNSKRGEFMFAPRGSYLFEVFVSPRSTWALSVLAFVVCALQHYVLDRSPANPLKQPACKVASHPPT